jgi:hypothetical protein
MNNTIDLETAVLEELGVLATGAAPIAADAAIVDDAYSALYEMLLTEGLVSWSADDDIPSFAEHPVTLMVAHLCAGKFAVPAQKRAELEIAGALGLPQPSLAERILRKQLAKSFVYSPQASEYF